MSEPRPEPDVLAPAEGLWIQRWCFRPLSPNMRFGGKGAVMTATLAGVTKNIKREPTAEEAPAREMVRRAGSRAWHGRHLVPASTLSLPQPARQNAGHGVMLSC